MLVALLAMLVIDAPLSTEPLLPVPTSSTAASSGLRQAPAAKPLAVVGDQGTTSPGPMPNGVPGQWHLIFDDEFTGNSLGPVWCPGWFGQGATNPVSSTELGPYLTSNVSVSDGSLHLREDGHDGALVSTNPADSCHGANPGFQFTYGLVEFRAWLPAGPEGIANWPTLWLDGQQWPQDGEINVLEGLNGYAGAYYHYGTEADWHGGNGRLLAGGAWAAGWHTFAAEWEPNGITFYYDGQPVWQTSTGIVNTPMYVVINDTVYAGSPVTPSTMRVDYVRVWQ